MIRKQQWEFKILGNHYFLKKYKVGYWRHNKTWSKTCTRNNDDDLMKTLTASFPFKKINRKKQYGLKTLRNQYSLKHSDKSSDVAIRENFKK